MKRRYSKKPSEHLKIAKERIEELFRQADLAFDERPDLSGRYVSLARSISMKYKVKIPSYLKRKFCKHCYSYLRPGKTARVRIAKQRVIYYCNNCRRFMRFAIRKPAKK
ncbi:MAG TPA: ribonuclease P protein component 4 [Candidatus Nanoarchaeia archaeon]|nr:ribonuclease P protein component 4 [Candidatus Nanoarchaeia archaeon]